MAPKMSPYRKRCMQAALADSRIAPAITYLEAIYPEDIGIPVDFKCIIWLAYHSLYQIRCRVFRRYLRSFLREGGVKRQ